MMMNMDDLSITSSLESGQMGIKELADSIGVERRWLSVYIAKHRFLMGIPYVYHKWAEEELESIRTLIQEGHRLRWIAKRYATTENSLRSAIYRYCKSRKIDTVRRLRKAASDGTMTGIASDNN